MESDQGTLADEERSQAELIGELRGLRSRLQILRAERTALAGKKYALDIVVEGLRGKVEELVAAAQEGDLIRIRALINDANLIGEGRGSSAGGLESERLAQLEALQQLEQKVSDLKEKSAGYRSERDTLRDQVGALDRQRRDYKQRAEEAEEALIRLEAEGLADAKAQAEAQQAVMGEAEDKARRLAQHAEALSRRALELGDMLGEARGQRD